MEESTLLLTQVIFRHGQKAPDIHYPYQGDPYANEKYLPFGPSQLTLTGRKQCYNLGQKLRNRYSNLLGQEYYYGIIDAKSSERTRARTSLELVLAGLFPPTSASKIEENLNWQPVPYTWKPIKEDNLIGSVITIMTQCESNPNFGNTVNSQEVIKCVKDNLKWEVKNQFQCVLMYDSVKTQSDFGLPVPEWCSKIYPEKLRMEYDSLVNHNFNQKWFIRGASGGLIQEINRIMIEKVEEVTNDNEKKMPKMFLYSGHDANIAGLMAVFKKLDVAKWPLYNANLSFELHQIKEEFFVKMVYQEGPEVSENFHEERKVDVLTFPNSKSLCKLSEFTEYVREYLHE